MCDAYRHNTVWAYRQYRCRCPEAVERMRALWRTKDRRRYVPGERHISRIRVDDVDEVAVLRAIGGEPLTLTVPERRAAAMRLTGLGLSAREIGHRLGVTQRAVQRYRQIHRLGTNAVESGRAA